MKENYEDEHLLLGNGQRIELDVYLPHHKLAFEYQGEVHYRDIYALGNRVKRQLHDDEKRKACREQGITLVQVPYWWDFQTPSLVATIRRHKEELVPTHEGSTDSESPGT